MGVGKICVKTKPFYLVLLDLNAQTRISTHLLITRSWCSWKAASNFLLKRTDFAKALKNTPASCAFKLIVSYLSIVFLARSSISPRYTYLAASSTWVAYRPIAGRNPLVAQTLSDLSQAVNGNVKMTTGQFSTAVDRRHQLSLEHEKASMGKYDLLI